MDDLLPGIDVRIHGEIGEFMTRFAELAKLSEKLRVEEKSNPALLAIRMRVLNFFPLFNTPHEGLFGQFVHIPKYKSRMHVEVAASRWNSVHRTHETGRPTYEVYVSAARSIFEELIRSYNQKYHTKLRLNVQPNEALGPILPPGARKVFACFVANANLTDLHPNDWQRFYAFAQYCHTRCVILGEESLFRILVLSGFNEKESRYIAGVYGHLRAFLKAPKSSYWALHHMPD